MNDRLPPTSTIERHLQLWVYLLPVVGIIPSIFALYLSPQSDRVKNREQKIVSRQSLSLAIVWLICYASFSVGAANMSEILSFRLLYANTMVTAAYFITCTVLMSRLNRKR